MSTLIFFALKALFLATPGSTFVLDGETCIAYPPCTCSEDYVRCDSKGLTTFPTFRVSNVKRDFLYINIENNNIATVPNNAFGNITVSNRSRIYIHLQNNHINNIPKNEFRGIANGIVELRLDSNNFSQIPSSLNSLQNLEVLNLNYNPISSLASSYGTLYSLRYSLHTLHIDLHGFGPSWPLELNVLVSLKQLFVTNLNTTHLDYNAFQAFEDKLSSVSIQFSQLERMPIAICHMKNLVFLTFSNNYNIHTNSTIFEPCNPKLTTVTNIDLRYNNLRYMPDILHSFPSLNTLYIGANKLSYIDWDLVPSDSPLTFLSMGLNDFSSIPSAISKLTKLQSLFLFNTKITSIEEFGLHTLSQLRILSLSYSPIEYISPNAFKYNSALKTIYLQNTQIKKLPSSLASLVNLNTLDLTNCPIRCNCDLSFLRPLNFSQLTVKGDCSNSPSDIQTFFSIDLPHCT